MERINFTDGLWEISNATYHESSAISRSALMHFKKSPYHFWHEYRNPEWEPKEPTEAMVFGEMVHILTLEPHLFDDFFIPKPDISRQSKAGKLAYSEFLVAAGTRSIVKPEDIEKAQQMALACRNNDLVASIMEDASFEQSIFFTHKSTGIQVKCRPDIWNGTLVGDLKTTADASFRAFQSSAFKYGYFLQAGMIHQGLESLGLSLEKFVFIAPEKEKPHAIGLFDLDSEAIDYGVNMFNQLMERLAECERTMTWESYKLQNLCLPKYAEYEVIE